MIRRSRLPQLRIPFLSAMLACASIVFGIDTTGAKPSDSAASPATMPSTRPATAAARTANEIGDELEKLGRQLKVALNDPADLLEETKRAEVAKTTVPTLRKMLALSEELAESGAPGAKMMAPSVRVHLLTLLCVLGDAQATSELENAASAAGPDASAAKTGRLFARWMTAQNDRGALDRAVFEAKQLARADPTSDDLTQTLFQMSQIGKSKPAKLLMEDLALNMKSKSAETIKERLAGVKKLRAMEGKPLTLAGAKVDGTKFTTADWKGKVILVDFWATWCGPCREALPRVKKAYQDYHEKGLEIVGISCDRDVDDLKGFLNQNKDVAWPQLFESGEGWHPLATEYGIDSIPRMFLIDKRGIVRSVTAREDFEKMIPQLLAEPGQDPARHK